MYQMFLFSTLLFTDIMGRSSITEKVIPEIVADIGEKRPVELSQHQAVLIMIIVRLSIGPVKPFNSLVPVLPGPLSLVVVSVVAALEFTV